MCPTSHPGSSSAPRVDHVERGAKAPGVRKPRKRYRLDAIRGVEVESGESAWNLSLTLEGGNEVIAGGTKSEMSRIGDAVKEELSRRRMESPQHARVPPCKS